MQNESKYIPPALRSSGTNIGSNDPDEFRGRDIDRSSSNSNYGGGGEYRDRDFSRREFGSWNGRGRDDMYDNNRYNGGHGYNRYSHDRPYSGGGRYSDNFYGGRSNNYKGDRGLAAGGYYGSSSRVNELGFHGDMRPNPRVEEELFFKGETQTAGINFSKYDNIPVEVSPGCPEPYNEFTVDTIGPQLLKNLVLTKFTKPTPVQKYSIPIGLAGGDMMACAQTGSGKTAGFLFPLIAIMIKQGPLAEPENRRGKASFITALVLAPTRELAVQIYEEAQKFCYCTGIRPVVVYGGANIQTQQRELDLGADILVATPGRLVDLIERGRVRLDIIRFLVLDEADRMLDMGFEPQIRRIVQSEGMPADRQTFMFSATFPTEIQRLAGDFMKDYVFLAVGRVGAASKDVTQKIAWVEQPDKVQFVIDFLSRVPEGLILIFVETKRGADYLEEVLTRYNFPASSIHGDKSQKEREDALKYFKSGRTPILVATDVAARGLDIPNVTQVINFDMPTNIDDYVHRIGRTGRVGNIGNALSLLNDKNRNICKELAELLVENQQELPNFLERFLSTGGSHYRGTSGGRGRGSGMRGHGGSKFFGAKDYRREVETSAHSANTNHHRGAPGHSRGSAGRSSAKHYGSSGRSTTEAWADSGDNSAW